MPLVNRRPMHSPSCSHGLSSHGFVTQEAVVLVSSAVVDPLELPVSVLPLLKFPINWAVVERPLLLEDFKLLTVALLEGFVNTCLVEWLSVIENESATADPDVTAAGVETEAEWLTPAVVAVKGHSVSC